MAFISKHESPNKQLNIRPALQSLIDIYLPAQDTNLYLRMPVKPGAPLWKFISLDIFVPS
jgi:hypothetical protein